MVLNMDSNQLKDAELIRRIQKYLLPPSSIGKTTRDTLREDLASLLIQDKLKDGNISILDVACGVGVILQTLKIKFKDHAYKISYHGIDQNHNYIQQLRHLELIDETVRFATKPMFTTTEILNYRPSDNELYDIIFVLNFIHEFDPSNIPQLIIKLNSMLQEKGTIAIIDMENIPKNEEEIQAICFKCEEIENILKSMGIESIPIRHRKRVDVFSLKIQKFETNIDEKNCLLTIKNFLEEKLNTAMDEYRGMLIFTSEWDNNRTYEWICLAGYICRLNESLRNINQKLKVIDDKTRNQR